MKPYAQGDAEVAPQFTEIACSGADETAVHHQSDKNSLFQRLSLRTIQDDFVAFLQPVFGMPQSAYAFAGILIFALGVSMGMNADSSVALSGLSVGDLASFLAIDDRFVVAEWV